MSKEMDNYDKEEQERIFREEYFQRIPEGLEEGLNKILYGIDIGKGESKTVEVIVTGGKQHGKTKLLKRLKEFCQKEHKFRIKQHQNQGGVYVSPETYKKLKGSDGL